MQTIVKILGGGLLLWFLVMLVYFALPMRRKR
jgi:hypothetical protein